MRARTAIAALTALACLGNLAQAQTFDVSQSQDQSQSQEQNSGGDGTGTAGSQQQGQSSSQRARLTATQNATATAGGGRASATGGNAQGGTATGGVGNVTVTHNTRRNVGGFGLGFMQPPSCGVAFSGGGAAVQGTGALGFSWETESCRKHRLATALANMGRTDAAVALLCSIGEIQEALALTESPCPTRQQAQPTMVATMAPAPARAQPVIIAAAPQPAPAQPVRPAYCAVHASRGIPPTQECL